MERIKDFTLNSNFPCESVCETLIEVGMTANAWRKSILYLHQEFVSTIHTVKGSSLMVLHQNESSECEFNAQYFN